MRSGFAVGVAALSTGLVVVPGASAAVNCTARASWGADVPRYERQVISLINAHRRKLGLPRLRAVPTLTRAARWKSKHMARYHYFDHADPSGRSPFQRMHDCGFRSRRALGENIAAGQRSPRSVVRAWLNSPGHRENIENGTFRFIGVGAVQRAGSEYGWYWTQDFGR